MDVNKVIKLLGKDNVLSVTKLNENALSFALKDMTKIELEQILKFEAIKDFNVNGKNISLNFNESVNEDFEKFEKAIQKSNEVKEKSYARKIFDSVIKAITGCINPAVPLLAGAGMGKVLIKVGELLNIFQSGDPNHDILKFIFDTPFYFLPALVGFAAGKVFKTNKYLSAFIGLMLVHPDFVKIVKAGEAVKFLGVNLPLFKYSAQIIPAILSIWLLGYVERFFKRIIPKSIELFTVPLLSILIVAPLSFLFIAPIGYVLGGYIASGVLWSAAKFGFIAIAILAAIYPWLVAMGLHKALSPVSIMLVAKQGYDPVVRVMALCSNIAQAASCLAISIRAKNENLKATAKAGCITAMLGGYTETALFGVNLRLKKPMFACMIGSAVAGAYAGLIGMKAYVYITPAILSLPMWIGDHGNYLIHAIITLLISTVVTFIATLIIGFDESEYEENE